MLCCTVAAGPWQLVEDCGHAYRAASVEYGEGHGHGVFQDWHSSEKRGEYVVAVSSKRGARGLRASHFATVYEVGASTQSMCVRVPRVVSPCWNERWCCLCRLSLPICAATRTRVLSADVVVRTPAGTRSVGGGGGGGGGGGVPKGDRSRLGSEVVLGTGDVAEFETPNWTPQFEPWYSPDSGGARSPGGLVPVDPPLFQLTGETSPGKQPLLPQLSSSRPVDVSMLSEPDDDVLRPPVLHRHSINDSSTLPLNLAVDVSSIPPYEVSVDVVSPFVSPTPTAAAVCVIAGSLRKSSVNNVEEGQFASTVVPMMQGRPDVAVSKDVLVGEALPVVRLCHLASLTADSVSIVDIRNVTAAQHMTFVNAVKRLSPMTRVIHSPASSLKPGTFSGTSPALPSPGLMSDIEMVLSDRDASAKLDRSLGEAFRYDSTGGLDLEMMNAAAGRPDGESICTLAISSSMQHRTYRKFPSCPTSKALFQWLTKKSPALASLKGQCVALYTEADVSSLVMVRDVLVRCSFSGVCGLSQTFWFANTLDET